MDVPFDQSEYERWTALARRMIQDAEEFRARNRFHWSCFASEQAAQCALKAMLRGLGKPAVTHSMKQLFDKLESLGVVAGPGERHAGNVLGPYYKGSRYPDQHPSGIPEDHFDERMAEEAVGHARRILDFIVDRRARL